MPRSGRTRSRTRTRLGNAGGVGYYGGRQGLTTLDFPTASSTPTAFTITGHADAHTKGAYTELIASTSGRVSMVRLQFGSTFTSATATSVLLDLATGTAGNESVIVANIPVGYRVGQVVNEQFPGEIHIPIDIPAGTRIAARIQSEIATGDTAIVTIQTYGGGRGSSGIDTMGANTTTSRGVAVAAGTSSAEGAWVEIEDATTATYAAIGWAYGLDGDADVQGGAVLMDIGVGAAASEVAILSNHPFRASGAEFVGATGALMWGLSPVRVAVGSRLAVRLQQSAAGAQNFDVVLFGIKD